MSRPPARLRRGGWSVHNVAASYGGTVAEGLVFILLTPFLVRELGLAQYGLWSLAVAFVDWAQMCDLGLREGIMKFTAAHQARAESREVRRVADAALFVYVIIGLAVLVLLAAFCWMILPSLVHRTSSLELMRAAVMLLGVSTAISFPAGIAGTLLEGLSRFEILNAIRVGHAALRLALVVLALQFGFGVFGLAAAELIARLGLHAARWASLIRVYPDLVPRPKAHRGVLTRLFDFGLWNVARQIAEVTMARMNEPVLSIFAGLPSVGAFHAGRRLATMPGEAIVPMAGVLFPLSSEMEAGGREEALRETLFKSTKIASVIALPLVLILAFGAAPIQTNWLGNRAPEAEGVMRVFAVAFLFVACAMPAESMLLGWGRVRLLALAGVAHTVVTLAVGIPLTRRLGAVGLAIASLVAVISTQFVVFLPAAARRCGARPLGLFVKSILPAWLAGTPVALAMLAAGTRISGGGLAALATWGGGAVLAYLAILWRIGLDADERAFVRTHARRLFLARSRDDDWEEWK